MTLKSCSVRINTNGSGYSASYFTFTNWHGGNGGDGGGLHNAGTLVVLDSSIAENKAGDGGDGGNNDYGGGSGGSGGSGGGIYNTGDLLINRSSIIGNSVVPGAMVVVFL